jgi:hypothetical protein
MEATSLRGCQCPRRRSRWPGFQVILIGRFWVIAEGFSTCLLLSLASLRLNLQFRESKLHRYRTNFQLLTSRSGPVRLIEMDNRDSQNPMGDRKNHLEAGYQ